MRAFLTAVQLGEFDHLVSTERSVPDRHGGLDRCH
jgi:hypothetical protein